MKSFAAMFSYVQLLLYAFKMVHKKLSIAAKYFAKYLHSIGIFRIKDFINELENEAFTLEEENLRR